MHVYLITSLVLLIPDNQAANFLARGARLNSIMSQKKRETLWPTCFAREPEGLLLSKGEVPLLQHR